MCIGLGETCLSGGEVKAEYDLELVDDANGEGKLGAPETEVDIVGGNADVPGLIISRMDGNDCRGGSW